MACCFVHEESLWRSRQQLLMAITALWRVLRVWYPRC
jgi:hypothetical protein